MRLDKNQIQKREVIGKLNGRDVILITTHGGLSLVAASKNGQLVTLGAGPHPGVSRWLAEKKEPDIIWSTPMMKSEADKDLICPTCGQLDTPQECVCIYRWGFVDKNASKF